MVGLLGTTGSVSDGDWELRAITTDVAGQLASPRPSARCTVDNTDPTSSLDDPGANLRDSVSLTANRPPISAAPAIASVAFQRFDGSSPGRRSGLDVGRRALERLLGYDGVARRALRPARDRDRQRRQPEDLRGRREPARGQHRPGRRPHRSGREPARARSRSLASASDPGGSGVATVAFQRFDGSALADDRDGLGRRSLLGLLGHDGRLGRPARPARPRHRRRRQLETSSGRRQPARRQHESDRIADGSGRRRRRPRDGLGLVELGRRGARASTPSSSSAGLRAAAPGRRSARTPTALPSPSPGRPGPTATTTCARSRPTRRATPSPRPSERSPSTTPIRPAR